MSSSDNIFDAIVVGLGGVGSAAAYHLASQGLSVCGIDQYSPPHPFGSSHGQTRIIRKAYFEHPDYVPLLERAYELWRALEQEVDQQLFVQTGLLQAGPPEGEVLSGIRRSAQTHHLPIESMSMPEACQRFPGLSGDPSWQALLELDAGYLRVEACIEAHLQLAGSNRAILASNETVLRWKAKASGVEVETDLRCFHAKKLVLAAGPWSAWSLNEIGLPLEVLRKYQFWFPAPEVYRQASGFPCFFFDTPAGYFYGFPEATNPGINSPKGLKVARHSGGAIASSLDGSTHPEPTEERQAVEAFVSQYLPSVQQQMEHWQGCYYTMTPDQHFIVDTLPDSPHVVIVAGLSGHGFKFTSVLGELAAQLASGQIPSPHLRFLSLDRFFNC